jgi:Carboxypeptidase regulatory-like domain
MRALRALTTLAVLLIVALPGYAQVDVSTGTLRGAVVDEQGRSVPQATVTVKNPATGLVRIVNTDQAGAYEIPALNPGSYEIQVEAQGFEKLVAKNVVLTVGQVVVYDAHLKIGSTNTVVEVTSSTEPLIEVDQSQQANTVNERQVDNLPNVTRNFVESIYTLPGVVDSSAPSIQDPNIGTGYLSSGFSIGGSNGRDNLFTIDGGENDFGSGALRVNHVPLDSVQEFQVNRNAFAAEFGFSAGTAINIITKSGTNKYHGSAYGYFHDETTDAANFFNSFGPNPTSKPFEQGAIVGGTLGGPIEKDKLFFFTSYEHQKLDAPVIVNLFGSAEAQGLSAQTNGFNPATGLCPGQTASPQQVSQLCYLTQLSILGGPLAPVGAALLASPVFSPLSDPILKALLTPDNGLFDGNAGGVVQAPPDQNGRYNNWVSRLDYLPDNQDSLSVRFSLMRERNEVTGPAGALRYTSALQLLSDYTLTTAWTHAFNANVINTVRVQAVPTDTSDNTTPFPNRAEIDLGNLGVVGTPFAYPYYGTEHRFQFDDSLSWVKGAHDFKFGVSDRPAEYNVFEQLWFGGQYQFFEGVIPIIDLLSSTPAIQSGLATYNVALGYPAAGPASTNLSAAESYVAGVPTLMLQASGNGQWSGWANYLGGFAEDSWKISPRFTLNYGVRLDYDKEPSPVPQSVRVSPRLGVAWDPHGDGKTVFRAGGGLFVAPTIFLVPFYLNDLGTSGRHINLALETVTGQPDQILTAFAIEQANATLANPNPELSTAQLAAAGIVIEPPGPNQVNGVFYTISPDFKPEYSIQASASIARQIGPNLSLEIGYDLYHSVHIEQNAEVNYVTDTALPVDPFIGPFYEPKPGSTVGEPNANILQNNQFSSIGNATYHGGTVSLTKRYGHGLQFQANYTYSRAIDDTSDYSSLSTPFRPDLLPLDRSASDFNITHSFVANAVYNMPFHAGQGILAAIFADVTVSPIVYARSGVPFTLLVPGLANGAGGHTSEARPYQEGRNTGIGPDFYSWDMRISKALYIRRDSGVRLEVIAQGTNLLNRANFNRVNNTFPDTAVVDPVTGLTASALVTTPEGVVNLLNGPYRYRGFVPTSAAELTTPLAFSSADPPRQLSFALQLAF